MATNRIQENVNIIKMMTLHYDSYLDLCQTGGDWNLHSFMKSLHEKAVIIEKELTKDD